ncbi:nuclear transport factor 2 family protein [Rhodococcus globerulus]|uniref:nuclear transport factor 2 family protein n=1 Tax=Rhodococcus globerulus TaxID=33008 RepID=UPI003016D556
MLSVQDRLELIDLSARYAACVDARDFDGMVGLFAPGAVLTLPDPPGRMDAVLEFAGSTAIREALGALGDYPLTQHLVAGHVLDKGLAADTASGTVACIANHLARRPDGRVKNLVWHLRYDDEYQWTDAGWRFSRRSVNLLWIESQGVLVWAGPELDSADDMGPV